MGFREPDSTIVVRFKPGEPYHGLEATVRSMTIDEWSAAVGWDGSDGDDQAKTLERFHASLVSWNLTDHNDAPIPVSESRKRDKRLILALSNTWVASLTGVTDTDPLPETSPSGETSPAPPIPMTPVAESPSQPN